MLTGLPLARSLQVQKLKIKSTPKGEKATVKATLTFGDWHQGFGENDVFVSVGPAAEAIPRVVGRISFFLNVGSPCEVRRLDPTTGALELPAVLELGGFGAYATQSALSTPHQYSMVVDPLGDLDGDSEANFAEILSGTSPIDAFSNSIISINSTGATNLGATPSLDVQVAAGELWAMAFGFAAVPAGSGLTFPSIGGELRLDLALTACLGGVR